MLIVGYAWLYNDTCMCSGDYGVVVCCCRCMVICGLWLKEVVLVCGCWNFKL